MSSPLRSEPASPAFGVAPRRLSDVWFLAAVIAAAVVLAGWHFRQYWPLARERWDGVCHDRHAHYLLGLQLGLDVRRADPISFGKHLDGARMWPPLHGLALGAVVALAGPDYRLAVLPSLVGWAVGLVYVFLLARRLSPAAGNLGGLIAALLYASSPAHSAYACDVMLESLGAGLTLAALYLLVRAGQSPTPATFRWLGLTLTLLFFEKYNYWLLVVLGGAAAAVWTWRRELRALAGDNLAEGTLQYWLRTQSRRPSSWAIAGAWLWAIAIIVGRGPLSLFGWTTPVRSPEGLLLLAHLLTLVRFIPWWRRGGAAWLAATAPAARTLALWHAAPIAVWFLWPQRLGYFVRFLGPWNGSNSNGQFLDGVRFYGRIVAEDYHAATMLLGVAAAGLMLAMLRGGALRRGGLAIALFLGLSALLAASHPNRKSRLAHTWVPAAWALAGSGAASLAALAGRGRMLGGGAAGLTLAACAALAGPAALERGESNERGQKSNLHGTARDLTDHILAQVADASYPAFFSNLPMKQVAEWAFLESGRRPGEYDVFFHGREELSAPLSETWHAWLATTPADALVFVDIPPRSYFAGRDAPEFPKLRRLLEQQSEFTPSVERDLPGYGCRVSVWRRRSSVAQQPGMAGQRL